MPRRLAVALAMTVGVVLGGCAIPFGNGAQSTDGSPQETPRDRNRRYLEEQERTERGRQTFSPIRDSER